MKAGMFAKLFAGLFFMLLAVVAGSAEDPNAAPNSTDPNVSSYVRASGPGLSNYKLGAGDVVTIRVFGEDDFSRERIKLTDAGTVPYPVLGELMVKGLTVGDLERLVADGLRGKYLKNPRVAVLIEEYRPFYINGMVATPGGYPYQPGLTVLKAAALAGGFKERAAKDKIFVIRADDPQQKAVQVEQGDLVYPGDIITVKESFF